jgi:stalled ribosome alternative rescue factor ArfA
MATPTKESAVKRIVRTPQFRMRVERDKTKYSRKGRNKKAQSDWAFLCLQVKPT